MVWRRRQQTDTRNVVIGRLLQHEPMGWWERVLNKHRNEKRVFKMLCLLDVSVLLQFCVMLIYYDVLIHIMYFKYASLKTCKKKLNHSTWNSIERKFKESKLIKQIINHVLIYLLINWYWTTSPIKSLFPLLGIDKFNFLFLKSCLLAQSSTRWKSANLFVSVTQRYLFPEPHCAHCCISPVLISKVREKPFTGGQLCETLLSGKKAEKKRQPLLQKPLGRHRKIVWPCAICFSLPLRLQ